MDFDKKDSLKQKAYKFSLNIIQLTQAFPYKNPYKVIGDQLLRSATSIGANLIEARSSSSKKEFIRFFDISLKSANETIYWLELMKDSNLKEINTEKIDNLLKDLNEICSLLGKSLITLKGKN